MSNNPLRNIPSVNELLDNPSLQGLVDKVSHNVVVSEVRNFLDDLRADLKSRSAEVNIPGTAELAERIAKWITSDEQPRLRPVINATGILLHTGLGRSPLAEEALEEVCEVSSSYASLEVDLDSAERSQRALAVEKLLVQLTGAEAAFVVNNNAGATMLTLAALAGGGEVIVSRGQLVEIGGSYRLPDVMSLSGAKMREVGTTNKTRLADFAVAIGDETKMLLQVHPSNYVVQGFTSQPSLSELVDLGQRHGVPVVHDIGSGALVDFAQFGLAGEPMPSVSVQQGADLALFSGDKLMGGPQSGIIVGRRDLVDQIIQHPLARALRVDKMTLAALAATLRLYRSVDKAMERVPLLRLVSTSIENLENRAQRLVPQLIELSAVKSAEVVTETAYLGGGSIPTQEMETRCVAIEPEQTSVIKMARILRIGTPAVFGRIRNDRLLLDLRSVFPNQDGLLVEAVRRFEEPTVASPE